MREIDGQISRNDNVAHMHEVLPGETVAQTAIMDSCYQHVCTENTHMEHVLPLGK
jgi:hypothetical protein